VQGTTIVLAPGVAWRHLDLPALEQFRGRGVYYGAAKCDWRAVQGKDIFLIGGGNSAGQAAVSLSGHANTVTLVVRGPALSKTMSHYLMQQLKTKGNIRVETHSEVVDVYGDEHLEAVLIVNNATGDMTRRDAVALFVMIGADAETGWLPPEIARDTRGYIVTGLELVKNGLWPLERPPFLLETSVPGIFAVGDVRAGSVKRVAAGVGEGSMAIAFLHQYVEAAVEPAIAR
jgi:thioredoxin reductase (NADPH)